MGILRKSETAEICHWFSMLLFYITFCLVWRSMLEFRIATTMVLGNHVCSWKLQNSWFSKKHKHLMFFFSFFFKTKTFQFSFNLIGFRVWVFAIGFRVRVFLIGCQNKTKQMYWLFVFMRFNAHLVTLTIDACCPNKTRWPDLGIWHCRPRHAFW